jgi:hypothetical protein
VPTPAPAPAPGSSAPAVDTIELTIDSIPAGATVYEGARALGQAPQTLKLVRSNEKTVVYLEKGALAAEYTINPMVIDASKPLVVRLRKGTSGRPRSKDGGARPAAPDETLGGELVNPYARPAP